jgi:hypothetical protein
MNEVATIEQETALTRLEDLMAAEAKELAKSFTPATGSYISIKGQTFNLPNGEVLPEFFGVILDFVPINMLYPKYNPNVFNAPLCWALGRDIDTLAPNEHVKNPISPSCAECPKNAWPKTGGAKECSNTYRIAVTEPEPTIDSEIYMLKVSPTSLKRWKNYLSATNRLGALGFTRTITRFQCDPNKDFPSLMFSMAGPTKDLEVALALRQRAKDMILVDPSQG